jgi:hypothetical protein
MKRAWALLLVAGLFSGRAVAWGPHTEITRAALAAQAGRQRLQKYFGPDWERLAHDYCWTPDWREAVRPDHYADDYLLFPGMPTHPSHLLPEVRRTHEPFFRRALQALRTESPRDAARWTGSLLHFVQDTGSPPHTTGVSGPTHGKMERWVDEKKIDIRGYEPRLLGKTDDEALRGMLERIEGLITFSKKRALKLRPLVEPLKERVNQPLELESALECAKVSADVVHTLFTLGLRAPQEPGCTLAGKLTAPLPDGYARVPARVLLAGTPYSTTTGPDGSFRFRDLPPGRYRVHLLATGCESETIEDVELKEGKATTLDRKLKPDPVAGNRVRNPDFSISWVKVKQPDCWRRDPARRGRWASALIRVPVGQPCEVRVAFRQGAPVPVAVRWRTDPSQPRGPETEVKGEKGGVLSTVIKPGAALKPFEKGFLFLEVLIETDRPLAEVCEHVAVRFKN